MDKKKILVCGAGGFIGSHLVERLKSLGFWVRAVDLKKHEFAPSRADEFIIGDLRDWATCRSVVSQVDEVYQLAADMGGAGYLFTGENDAAVMHNSALVNLNVLEASRLEGIRKIFYSSSACIYPLYNQEDPENPNCVEHSAYPAMPDSEYGWEKLFSERLYLSYHKNHKMQVRIARFHNIFGPSGTWAGGKEKAPAAICRKVAEAEEGTSIEIWGDGLQSRSFLYIDECIEGIIRLMNADFIGPVNIGSEELISINDFARMVIDISGKSLGLRHVSGPIGVKGRNSNNDLIREKLNWAPSLSLRHGLEITYRWISQQLEQSMQQDSLTGQILGS